MKKKMNFFLVYLCIVCIWLSVYIKLTDKWSAFGMGSGHLNPVLYARTECILKH